MKKTSKNRIAVRKSCFLFGGHYLETFANDVIITSSAVSEQCFTSPPTHYRLYGRRFLHVKRPNQRYQSTEGDATKEKEKNEND